MQRSDCVRRWRTWRGDDGEDSAVKVYILTKEYDYNGRLILDVYASRELAELERKRLSVMPQYIEDDLVIDERELRGDES